MPSIARLKMRWVWYYQEPKGSLGSGIFDMAHSPESRVFWAYRDDIQRLRDSAIIAQIVEAAGGE